ncbi:MAG: hypothetical protein DMG65_21300 [Candidatus Angelobacter sp. Gp1-AA117]|nr:MAG: hypothetical protein DMG65_21300 [Candidatus Angelobacter sp. Gp1-AA117]
MNCAVHNDKPATAYCRTCGKALCDTCKRDVMGAIYCEPCLAARVHGISPNTVTGTPVTVVTDPPSPAIATMLGFIPGVGAMYNGQFPKALLHLGIFVTLILLIMHGRGLTPVFGICLGFFIIYMVFEAHQTAKARQLGRPLPDPLGLNHILGIQETAAGNIASPVDAQRVPVIPAQGESTPPAQGIPVGAIILIGLGVIFLIGKLPGVDLDKLWPLFLIGLGVWIAYKRTVMRG